MSGEAPESWSPPTDLGQVPEELQERARLISDAQTEAALIIESNQADRTKHLHAIDTIPAQDTNVRLASLNVIG